MKFIKTIWNDPVGSKVIAAGLIVFLSQIGIFIWGSITKIEFFDVYTKIFDSFKTEYIVKGWYLILLYAIILSLVIWPLLRLYKSKNKVSKEDEERDIVNESAEPELSEIREAPTAFFHYRFCDAFPGFDKGHKWFDSTIQIHKRLSILLQKPISFDI
jgi:hypothetical protein